MSEDGGGWPEIPPEPHDDAGADSFHDELAHEPGWAAEAEPEDFGHYGPDFSGEPAGTGDHSGHHPDDATPPAAESRPEPDQGVHPADDLPDDHSPHDSVPEEPAVFEPGATLFCWSGEQPPGEDVPSLLIEPGYLEEHYASGWALDPHGDGGILAAQGTARPPGGEDQPTPGPGDDPARDPAAPRPDHGLRADVLLGGWTT
jgi:hypothetical protein